MRFSAAAIAVFNFSNFEASMVAMKSCNSSGGAVKYSSIAARPMRALMASDGEIVRGPREWTDAAGIFESPGPEAVATC